MSSKFSRFRLVTFGDSFYYFGFSTCEVVSISELTSFDEYGSLDYREGGTNSWGDFSFC